MKKFLEIKDITAYRAAFELSNEIFNKVMKWDYFAKDTVGRQLVRAVDSISANIAEGFGRYFKKDKINFYRYSYGSLAESLDWIEKANVRRLIKDNEYQVISSQLKGLFREIRHLINFTEEKLTI